MHVLEMFNRMLYVRRVLSHSASASASPLRSGRAIQMRRPPTPRSLDREIFLIKVLKNVATFESKTVAFRCIDDYLTKETGCARHDHECWSKRNDKDDLDPSVIYDEIVEKLRQTSESEIIRMTGCRPPCRYIIKWFGRGNLN